MSVVRQRFETSCGAAAIATMLSYYFQEPTSEEEILRLVMPEGKTLDRGLNVEELKQAVALKRYRAASRHIELPLLLGLPEPAIVILCPAAPCPPGKLHFSVFRGSTGDAIHLADPSRGHIVMGLAGFRKIWTGILLILDKDVVRNPTFFLKATGRPEFLGITPILRPLVPTF